MSTVPSGTVDASGAIHGSDGRFTGHVSSESSVRLNDAAAQSGSPDPTAGPSPAHREARMLSEMQRALDEAKADNLARHLAETIEQERREGYPEPRNAVVFIENYGEQDEGLVVEDEAAGFWHGVDVSDRAAAEVFLDKYVADFNGETGRLRLGEVNEAAQQDSPTAGLTAMRDAADRQIASYHFGQLKDNVRQQFPTARYVVSGSEPEAGGVTYLESIHDSDGVAVFHTFDGEWNTQREIEGHLTGMASNRWRYDATDEVPVATSGWKDITDLESEGEQ